MYLLVFPQHNARTRNNVTIKKKVTTRKKVTTKRKLFTTGIYYNHLNYINLPKNNKLNVEL